MIKTFKFTFFSMINTYSYPILTWLTKIIYQKILLYNI